MKRGIAEYRIELIVKIQRLTIHHQRIHAKLARCLNHRSTAVDTQHITTELDEFQCQRTIATAKIEDAFASLCIEQIKDGRAKVRDKTTVSLIVDGIPLLVAR